VRFPIVAAVALALVVAQPPKAEAKLCVSIDAPRVVRVGTRVTVRVTALQPGTWIGLKPVDVEPARMPPRRRLVLQGPGGERREAVLRRTPDPAVAAARFRLDRPGRWTLSVTGWEYAPRACAPRARIVVR